MAKYAVGDEVIIKCFDRLKQEGNIEGISELYCGIRVKIKDTQPDGSYYCDHEFGKISENIILGKSGGIALQSGLAIACRDRIQIASICSMLGGFKGAESFIDSIRGIASVRIFITYNNWLKCATSAIDSLYFSTSYNSRNYNYIEFFDLAFKNETEIRKLNQCKILYNDLAHCYCSEECGRCSIEV